MHFMRYRLLLLISLLVTIASISFGQERVGSTHDKGVSINGVTWSRCNVGAFGTFAAAPEDFGMLYQWNRETVWLSYGNDPVSSPPGAAWDSSKAAGSTWNTANDPCPRGWRVPTKSEQATLLDSHNVANEWVVLNNVKGCRFTDRTSGLSIFLPAAGARRCDDGTLCLIDGYAGVYWSTGSNSVDYAWTLSIYKDLVEQTDDYKRSHGHTVRCVRR